MSANSVEPGDHNRCGTAGDQLRSIIFIFIGSDCRCPLRLASWCIDLVAPGQTAARRPGQTAARGTYWASWRQEACSLILLCARLVAQNYAQNFVQNFVQNCVHNGSAITHSIGPPGARHVHLFLCVPALLQTCLQGASSFRILFRTHPQIQEAHVCTVHAKGDAF